MTEFSEPPIDDRLEAYLDGVMDESERAAFEAEINRDPRLAAEVALQAKLDAAVGRQFPVVAPTALHLESMQKHFENVSPPFYKLSGWRALVPYAVVAAVFLIAFGLWGPRWSPLNREPTFTAVPLAQVYHQTVKDGFEPYYECHDDKRFADTFESRQGIPLHLTEMPEGSMMKGLSYLGGLSRETTAMLCDVEGEPVMVFVDRAEKDRLEAAKESDSELNIFRAERDGLVFYEVTPLDKPTMTKHMVLWGE
jgi:hypothetical protein